MTIQIGTVTLGKSSSIAAVATDSDIVNTNSEAFTGAEIIEIRVDLFQSIHEDYVKKIWRKARTRFSQPFIGTVRAQDEGGALALDERQRISLYKIIIPFSAAIDIEIGHSSVLNELKPSVKSDSCVIIGSYHNFKETPAQNTIEDVFRKGQDLGVDIVKIVTMAHTGDDIITVTNFLLKHRGKNLIIFAMGSAGLITRIINPIFGSLITYGFVSKSAAPGQLSVRELSSYLRNFDPKLNPLSYKAK
jgi:3-dehydroquinate dehydratase-1